MTQKSSPKLHSVCSWSCSLSTTLAMLRQLFKPHIHTLMDSILLLSKSVHISKKQFIHFSAETVQGLDSTDLMLKLALPGIEGVILFYVC